MQYFYRNSEGQWPRYEHDIQEEFPGWKKDDDLPEGWVIVAQADDFMLPEPIFTVVEEGDGEVLPANIRFGKKFKLYDMEIFLNNETNEWTVKAVLSETEIEVSAFDILPVEWFINGEWTNDGVAANDYYNALEPEPEA